MDCTACLTCLQQPEDETEQQNICHSDLREIVRKHFWFSDAELAQAWICEVCWETISAFHQFYVDVEQLYETKPVPELEAVTVKEEKDFTQVMLIENEIKEEVLSDDMQEEDDQEEFGDGEQLYTVELKEDEEKDSDSDSDDSMSTENEADSDSQLSENHPDNVIRRHVELTCQECDDAGSFTFKELTIHSEKVHGNKKPFVLCCGSKYIKRCYLLEHVRYVLNPDAFLCKHCDEAFTNGGALKRHLKVRHGKGQTRRYNSENRLRKDKSAPIKNEEQLKKREEIELKRQQKAADDKIMLGHVKFECVPCGESFISFTQLHTHSTSKHKVKPVVTCCGNRYNSRCKLWQHVTSVLNPVAYRCELCMRCFNSEYAKDTHRRKMHPTEEELKYHCERCQKAFSREIAYKRHMQDHEDADHGRIKCEECGKMFKSRTVLYMHVRKKHVAPQFVCDICAKAFHQPAEFEKHKLEHEDPDKLRMQCQHCLKWFKNREYWRTHIRLHNPTTPVPCELCDRVCQNKRAWRAHMKNAHGTPDKVCELCGKCFKKKQSLQEHIAAVHTGMKLFSCPFCPRNFNSSSNMHTHKKNMHPEEYQAMKLATGTIAAVAGPSEARMMKEEAYLQYKSHAVLYVHIRNYHTEPRFVCDICAKPFRIMSEFKKHKLSHEDPDKLKMQCPHCMKWYKTREYWRAHIRLTHRSKQNQMIQCEMCDKSFSRKDKMRAHMKNVHEEPTKKCEYCEKCFTKDISLREHVASQHTGEVLYTCSFCPKTFNSNANMFSHRRKMHPVEWLAARERSEAARQRSDLAEEDASGSMNGIKMQNDY